MDTFTIERIEDFMFLILYPLVTAVMDLISECSGLFKVQWSKVMLTPTTIQVCESTIITVSPLDRTIL